ncbi:MAG TPA: Fe(2+) transporter permease subunit FeoB [Gammaproteobacteria bacterium]|nr:Fe(2+) transporter permease subunit FeoB [Gammaproteobacteria bacterium]
MTLSIGLVGNPNSGKTTVFNALTGGRQRVGNWPGVTVERKTGSFEQNNVRVNVVDLPGTYSLTTVSESSSIDERIACDYILNHNADLIINVLDASNLERNLYLTLQLIEMRVPMIIALNMMDIVEQRGMNIIIDKLEKNLNGVVVPLSAQKGKGIKELKQAILNYSASNKKQNLLIHTEEKIRSAIQTISNQLHHAKNPEWLAIRLLEEDVYARSLVDASLLPIVAEQQKHIREALSEDPDILLADARYRYIQNIMKKCVEKNAEPHTSKSTWLDHIILNRVLGIPIFLGVMYCLFFFSINIGGAFQDFFDIGSDTIFVQGGEWLFTHLQFPTWLTALLADGIGKGINTTITFIPVIGALFLFLAFLEDSGYMARAAFVVDRLMRALGLPGKSFVPMIVGFGCNVPAVMATRTLENKRDRILTVMMSPFMSCGARLAIYAVFTAAFFPSGGQNIVFMLYLVGILMAVLTGFLLRKTVLKGDPAPLVMELPPYHVPHLKTVLLHAWQRLKGFVFRAGKLIVPICILIGALNAWNLDGSVNGGDGSANSMLSVIGRAVTPIFAPMGIDQTNWPATVGLVTGVLAKEVVVGTLNTIYSQVGHLASHSPDGFHFWGGLQDAVKSIPANLAQLGHALSNPVLAKAPVHTLTREVYGVMYQHFGGKINAIAYLLFVLLYFPCVSTTAAMLREVHRGWAIFSVFWTTGVAWCVAVGFYQAATFFEHPLQSVSWLIALTGILFLTVFSVKNVTVASLEAA